MQATMTEREAQADASAGKRWFIRLFSRLVHERAERLNDRLFILVKPKGKLRIRQAKRAGVNRGKRRACLKCFHRHAKPPRQDAQRLQGGIALARFDARDVRIRDARAGKLPLRKTLL